MLNLRRSTTLSGPLELAQLGEKSRCTRCRENSRPSLLLSVFGASHREFDSAELPGELSAPTGSIRRHPRDSTAKISYSTGHYSSRRNKSPIPWSDVAVGDTLAEGNDRACPDGSRGVPRVIIPSLIMTLPRVPCRPYGVSRGC